MYDPFRQADGVNRADRGLRRFGRRVGDAIMCPRCDGDGVVLANVWNRPTVENPYHRETVREPVKCPDCGGEGLDSEAMREMKR